MARSGEAVTVAQGKSQLIHIARRFSKVLVGNQEVADVLPMNAETLYVLGKKPGATNLTVYDKAGQLVAVIDLIVGADVSGLRSQLAALLPGEPIGVRGAGDSVVIDGQVSNAVVAERAARIAETYAPGKVVNFMSLGSPQQVLLEVRFSEMQRSTVKELGFRSLTASRTGNFQAGSGDDLFTGDRVVTRPTDAFATIFGSFGLGGLNINLALDALEEKGLVNTLAQPNLIALSGETASFLAGGEFPIPVASSVGQGGTPTITIEFKEFGVSLAFTPTVLANGMISLVVAPEVSSIDPNASIRLNTIIIPGLRTRRARTTLEMRDGESFAIAGLVGADFANSVRQVPLLGSIPIIGALFRSTRFNRNETELVITVTPHIVRPVAPAALSMPTDRVRAPGEAEQLLLGARQAPQGTKKP
ncbi:type II and III secretion system protein family protein [Glacieibacterium frigidum]|uniref:type II and III secretion system protein family protein n=1 Tax=Glacieibacterium frigidum TaxID=2593303 RepID=UPI00163DAC4C|nr:type II and III secretion system protein family protein [Glacieibacterium frigidum]